MIFRIAAKRILVIALFVVPLAGVVAAQEGKLENVAAQASAVTEFDVNGMKVILKRRASAPTLAGGLFIRGGSRNVGAKKAGIENLMLTTAIE
ncbi:MAG: hypothetical protein LC734_07190, partial [Acidobacteria bacterium]|nr:hypothetical protein [Acidobacteriota bacterium]